MDLSRWDSMEAPTQSDLTDTTDPTSPTDLTDPTDPTSPTDPTDPTDPTSPTDLRVGHPGECLLGPGPLGDVGLDQHDGVAAKTSHTQ